MVSELFSEIDDDDDDFGNNFSPTERETTKNKSCVSAKMKMLYLYLL